MRLEQYEIWIIDYFDGKLNASQEEELMLFLEKNPEKMDEFRAFELIKLTPNDQIKFENKHDIIKRETLPFGTINQENYGARIIDRLEQNSSLKRENELNQFLAINPHIKEEISDFDNITLKPNLEIKYAHKEKLKKGRKLNLATVIKISTAIAAVLFLLILAFPAKEVRESRSPLFASISKTQLFENSLGHSKLEEKKNSSIAIISNYETEKNITTKRESAIAISSFPVKTSQIQQWVQYPYFLAERYNYSQLQDELQLAKQIKEQKSNTGFFALVGSALGFKNKKNNDPFIWKAATWSINKYNTLTDKDILLSKIERSNSNNITYGLHSENFNIQRNVKKH